MGLFHTSKPSLCSSSALRGEVALMLLAGACLVPFLRLAYCAHPYLDDFIFPVQARQLGVWSYTVRMYQLWQGRFAASMLTALHPLAWGGLPQIQPFTCGFILVVAGSVCLASAALLRGPPVAWSTRLAAGSLVLALLLILLPSPTEAFYWLSAGLTYMGGTSCCLLLLGSIAQAQTATVPTARRLWWLLAAGLAGIAPGFSEMISCFVLAAVLVLLPLIGRGQVARRWLVLLALAVGAAAVATLAPGNFVRQASAPPLAILRSLALATVAVGYTLASWLGNGLVLLLTLLVLPALQRLVGLPTLPIARLTSRAWYWPTWFLLGLWLCFMFSYLAVHGPPPARARNLLLVFFLISWFLTIAGLLAYRMRRGWPRLSGLPRYGQLTVAGLVVAQLLTDHNIKLQRDRIGVPTNSVIQAYADWLSGDAARYDREEEARYALIYHTAEDAVAVPALSRQPLTLVWWDISYNPALWGNQGYAKYFHKRAIWVIKPGAN